MMVFIQQEIVDVSCVSAGSGLLSQHGHHASGCQTPQCHDRPPNEKGEVNYQRRGFIFVFGRVSDHHGGNVNLFLCRSCGS